MKQGDWLLAGLLVGGSLMLLLPPVNMLTRILSVLSTFIPSVEGFRPTPYWDVSRWSWGYGTQAPGPAGSISREQAFAEMTAHLVADYNYLRPLINRSLTANQWAALLSFSYNVGPGNADNLIANINSGDQSALAEQWHKYVYADGQVSSVLIDRRTREWALWQT